MGTECHWSGQGESDCLTKHCDGLRSSLVFRVILGV